MISNATRNFDILVISLNIPHNSFASSIKLFLIKLFVSS